MLGYCSGPCENVASQFIHSKTHKSQFGSENKLLCLWIKVKDIAKLIDEFFEQGPN